MSLVDLLIVHTWWQYDSADPLHQAYHFFNLAEGTAWLFLAGLVATRWLRHRKSIIEIAYATAFLCFGFTDFREAYRLQSWLILVKGINLLVLLVLRRRVIRQHYPASKLF